MRTFVNREFARFVRKSGLTEAALCDAADRLRLGNVDADLGGGVFKQRVAREGAGKSGGFRTILIFRFGRYCVFVLGFAKKDRANITPRELAEFKIIAKTMHAYDDETYNDAIRSKVLFEIFCKENVP